MAQLRMGHCALNNYFYRFGKRGSPYCECGYGKETVQHFLLECRNYRAERKSLREKVGTGRMKLIKLFGDPTNVRLTMDFVESTGRLQ